MAAKLLILFILCCQPAVAEIYKWVDENGRIHFTDRSREGQTTETVDIKINSYTHSTVDFPEREVAAKPPTVIMYSTAWCGYCKQARQHFRSKGIAYTEYDIEANLEAKKKYKAINGRGVPVILVGKQRMNGFNTAGFDRFYQSVLTP
jgi:glutaredoxin